eukprot:gnl/TRDRNA2_/TRDRNA2_41407_c0_seq1.p1 gnl/TRDRNA2_/TRDRNA2_41407_c0~~gnl/TRDRNA2_/TRDRNA2_41407_c0_seq1.p1  ORF type:complete len:426 (+),score=56.58 gnl/TRDRNA2_/TRDRNA2_41407_c0_seq1:133-1410(+)
MGTQGAGGMGASAKKERMEGLVLAHQMSVTTLSMLTLQPRAKLLDQAHAGDVAAIAQQVSQGAAVVALSDFLLSPSVGALSDRVGRRPLMLLAPAATLPLKAAATIWPSASMLLVERVACDALRTLGGTTMAYACLSDLYQGEAYTHALARLNGITGVAIVVAPLLASRIKARHAFAAATVLSALHLIVAAALLEETSCVSSSEDADQKDESPIIRPVWRFLRLFFAGARLRWRACIFTLHCVMEGKVVQDQVSLLQLGDGWETEPRSRWTSGLGLGMVVGSRASGPILRWCGDHGFTAVCHAASLGAFLMLRKRGFWGGLVLLSIGNQRRTASVSWVISEAMRAGFGRGEALGWVASLRAAVDFLSALLYGVAYRSATSRKRPFDVLLLPAVLTALAEVLRAHVARENLAPVNESGTAVATTAR